MASLSKHGGEVGRIYFTTTTKAYMADGTILKLRAGAWKLAGKLKAGLTPQHAYEKQLRIQQDYESARPALARYRKRLREVAGMGKAWKLHLAISMMPDDCDGVWSECCDGYSDNVHADIDEIADLCRDYGAAVLESKSEPLA